MVIAATVASPPAGAQSPIVHPPRPRPTGFTVGQVLATGSPIRRMTRSSGTTARILRNPGTRRALAKGISISPNAAKRSDMDGHRKTTRSDARARRAQSILLPTLTPTDAPSADATGGERAGEQERVGPLAAITEPEDAGGGGDSTELHARPAGCPADGAVQASSEAAGQAPASHRLEGGLE